MNSHQPNLSSGRIGASLTRVSRHGPQIAHGKLSGRRYRCGGQGSTPQHPGDNIKPLPDRRPERRIFEAAELVKLLAVKWSDPRTYVVCAIAECTGMRLGEIRGLLVKNVHLDERYVDALTNYVETDGLKHPKQRKDGRPGLAISERATEARRAA